MQKNPKILIAAGGSGGHLFPAQQLISLLHGRADVMIAGSGLSKSPFFNGGVPFRDIAASAPKKGFLLRFFANSCRGFFQSVRLLLLFSPDVVVGFGSYHTFPVLLASVVLRKKIVLFEANCVLGKVNRLFSPYASKIAIQFPLSRPLRKSAFVSLLPWIKKEEGPLSKEFARSYFGLNSERRTILVFGGSQGAAFFNEVMPKVILNSDWQVIHCTGKGTVAYPGVNASVKGFEKRMDLAYAAADLVICRSGAGTVAELIRYRKPSLLVPFPHASDNHQWENGRFLAHLVKGARILKQEEASAEKIREEIEALFREIPARQEALGCWKMGDCMDISELVLNG